MRVDPQEQRPADTRLSAIRADRLRDRQNVLLVERAIGCAAAVARGSERHALRGNSRVGTNRIVIGDQTLGVDKAGGFRRLTCKRANGHVVLYMMSRGVFCYRVKLLQHDRNRRSTTARRTPSAGAPP